MALEMFRSVLFPMSYGEEGSSWSMTVQVSHTKKKLSRRHRISRAGISTSADMDVTIYYRCTWRKPVHMGTLAQDPVNLREHARISLSMTIAGLTEPRFFRVHSLPEPSLTVNITEDR